MGNGENARERPRTPYDFEPMELDQFIAETRRLPMPEEIIQRILPKMQIGLIAGDAWVGKSLEHQSLACAFGAGGTYHGLPVKKCRAVYITWEGSGHKIADRFEKIRQAYKMELEPIIKLASQPMPLNLPSGQDAMLRLLDPTVSKGAEVALVDSFPHTIKGRYSKDEGVLQAWFDGIDRIIGQTGITPIITWTLRKLIFSGIGHEDPFSLDRLKGGAEVAYWVNTVIMIGELKKQGRPKGEDGKASPKSVYTSLGRYIVLKKVKDAICDIPALKVSVNHEKVTLEGQHWVIDGNEILAEDD